MTSAEYDPDRWARRWAFAIGAALVLSSFVPVWWKVSTDILEVTGWQNDWTGEGVRDVWDVWVPPLAGLVALATVVRMGARLRGATLLILGMLPVARAMFEGASHFFGVGDTSFWFVGRGLVVLSAFVGAVTAAGNHLRRRHPESSLARRIAGVGGLLLAIGFGVLLAFGLIAVLQALGGPGSGFLIVLGSLAGIAYVFLYGLLSATQRKSRAGGEERSLFLARMGRIFVFLASVGAGILDASSHRYETNGPGSLALFASRATRTLLHEGGQAALMALGIAAAFEPRVRRSSGPADPEDLERVFG